MEPATLQQESAVEVFVCDPAGLAKAMCASGFRARAEASTPCIGSLSDVTALGAGSAVEPPPSFDPGPDFAYDWSRLKVTRVADTRAAPAASYRPFDPGPQVRYDWSRTESARLERKHLQAKPFDPGNLGLETNPDRLTAPRVAATAAIAMVVAVLAAAPFSPLQLGAPEPAAEPATADRIPPPQADVIDPGLTPIDAGQAADGILRARKEPGPRAQARARADRSESKRTDVATPIELSVATRQRRSPPGKGPFFPIVGKHGFGESLARFGAPRSGHIHAGQDVFAPAGTPLVAIFDSVVIDNSVGGGGGNTVTLYSRRSDKSYAYLHLVEPTPLKIGQRVRAGQVVGAVGCTGSCFGDHLHFEIRQGRDPYGPAIDPLPALLSWPQLPQ